MNLPNKLTLSRLVAVLNITLLFYLPIGGNWVMFVILGLFILASITDFLDGHIARKHNMVTGFGKLMDPLADKMLVITTCIIIMDLGIIPFWWMLIIIVFRELLVSGIRLLALESNAGVIAADIFGKAKTMTQMVSLVVLLFYAALLPFALNSTLMSIIYWIGAVLFYVSMVLLVLSGIRYFWKNRKIFQIK